MEPELFEVLSELEMQDQKERMRNLPSAERIKAMDPDAAKLLSILAASNKAKNIVEVGSGVGYSTLWLAYAASLTGGKVLACELDPTTAETLRANVEQAGMSAYVQILVGDARDTLRQREEPVDFLFLDAQKDLYETYFDVVYKRMGVGALVVADNVTSHADELLDFITYMQNHPSLESVSVPLGRGLEVTVKTAE